MELSTIKTKTTWSEVANTINQNNQKIEAAILNATEKLRGYFITEESLRNIIPVGKLGDIAYVFNANTGGFSYYIYTWNGSNWENTNQQYTTPDVNLNDYVPLKGNSTIDGNLGLTGGIGINGTQTIINDGTITTTVGVVISRATQQSVVLSDGSIKPITEMGNLRASTIENTTDYDDVF